MTEDAKPLLCAVHVWAKGSDYQLTNPPTWLYACTRCHSLATGKEGETPQFLRQLPADDFANLLAQPQWQIDRPSK